jgi:hypothetical protein
MLLPPQNTCKTYSGFTFYNLNQEKGRLVGLNLWLFHEKPSGRLHMLVLRHHTLTGHQDFAQGISYKPLSMSPDLLNQYLLFRSR